MNKIGKRSVAGLEITLMIISFFAISHSIHLTEDVFADANREYKKASEGARLSFGDRSVLFVDAILGAFSKPMIPIVSALDINKNGIDDKKECKGLSAVACYNLLTNDKLNEKDVWKTYPISSESEGLGCCLVSLEGQICGTASADKCYADSPFAKGALCTATDFCQMGCCYDKNIGVYSPNTLKAGCPKSWDSDATCSKLPGARKGCCVMGSVTKYLTRRECEISSGAVGDSVDWRDNVNEGGCFLLSAVQKEGACILDDGGCDFVTGSTCFNSDGKFHEDVLCTSPDIKSPCDMTKNTDCFIKEGKNGVYFIDSCGNPANIYDSARVNDLTYWDKVIAINRSCGYDQIDGKEDDNGNANSATCGNCKLSSGGICAPADDFDVKFGDNYCKDTSCDFTLINGTVVNYGNTESWCVYDGAIGNGNDVPGSRHWKYSCNRGVVESVACQDARSEICVQSLEQDDGDGGVVEFSSASCIVNNWGKCININSEEIKGKGSEVLKQCVLEASTGCYDESRYPDDASKVLCLEEAERKCKVDTSSITARCNLEPGCRMHNMDVSSKFQFELCLPEYPAGWDFTSERSQTTGSLLCGMASMTCTAVQKPKTWGGCEWVANEDCMTPEFAEDMNEFCRSIGDCGGSVNINGDWSPNYRVREDGRIDASYYLSNAWIKTLREFANPIAGDFIPMGNFSKAKEEALGFDPSPRSPGEDGYDNFLADNAAGAFGVGMTAKMTAGGAGKLFGSAAGGASASFGAVVMGAAVGAVAGAALAKHMGLSPGGSILMTLGGAMIGAAVTAYAVGLIAIGPMGWIILAAIIIMAIASTFMGSDCDNYEIKFECKPWQPVSGGAACDSCNKDPMKPCSKYRCESLGARCEFINVGTDHELCTDGDPNDVTPPSISRSRKTGNDNVIYVDTDDGFDVTDSKGGCLNASMPFNINIDTNEPAQCRWDLKALDFESLSNDFVSTTSYVVNHSVVYVLPDPSHGKSQGLNISANTSLFIKCKDRSGIKSVGFFRINMCVNEGKDITAPVIAGIYPNYPGDESIVGSNESSKIVSVITYELAECKWDFDDDEYVDMENSFTCRDTLGKPSHPLGYKCLGKLPINDTENTYRVRCMDQPWLKDDFDKRNANAKSKVVLLKRPKSKISIDKIWPKEDFEIGTSLASVDLKIATSGGGEKHFCKYSLDSYDNMLNIIGTGKVRTHEITLSQAPGKKEIYVECWDESGDFDRNMTAFIINRDASPPDIARVWQDGNYINLFLSEEGTCKYSKERCRFAWKEGTFIGTGTSFKFSVSSGDKYYIRCEDGFGNAPNGCSVEVMAA